MKKLALFDIDGVIYDGYSIFDQIQDQEKRGIIKSRTWDKILLELQAYKSGQKTYVEAANKMLEVSADSIRGLENTFWLDDTKKYMSRHMNKFFPYFKHLVNALKDTHEIYFVTTNFQIIPQAIGEIFGINNYLSSRAEVVEGKFTGKVEFSMAGNKGIVARLINVYGRLGSIAVGDSEDDADMLDLVEFPFVMEPNEKLAEIAKSKNWQIVNRDTIADIILKHAK